MAKNLVVCRRLKGLMVEKGMTIPDLAKKTGISESGLQQKINGHRSWWFEEALLLVRVLGLSEVREVLPEIYEAAQKSVKKGSK